MKKTLYKINTITAVYYTDKIKLVRVIKEINPNTRITARVYNTANKILMIGNNPKILCIYEEAGGGKRIIMAEEYRDIQLLENEQMRIIEYYDIK